MANTNDQQQDAIAAESFAKLMGGYAIAAEKAKQEWATKNFNARMRLISLGFLALSGAYIISPLSGWGQQFFQAGAKVAATAKETTETVVETAIEAKRTFAPGFKQALKKGDRVAGYTVTSPFDPARRHPVTGKVRPHNGVDLNTPKGTQMYAIGSPGEDLTIRCWYDKNGGGQVATFKSKEVGFKFQYLHLQKCQSGQTKAGRVIALSGDSGIGTGAHAHIEQVTPDGKKISPWMGFVNAALTGNLPEQKEDEKP